MTGITFSGLLRGMKTGTLSVENCLRLAEALGENPADVLRAAQKPDVAELIERLYGKGWKGLSLEQRELLDRWEAMSPRARESFKTLMSDLAPKATKAQKKSA